MSLSLAALNRATLARQGLLDRWAVTPGEAARRVLAVQGQLPAAAYVALWNRIEGLDLAAVDRAFVEGELIRGTLLRVTLHVAHADDHRMLHHAMQPTLRAARLNDSRFRDTGATAAEADALVAPLLQFLTEPRSRAEVEAWLMARGHTSARLWWALRHYAPVRRAVSGGAWLFDEPAGFAAAATTAPAPDDVSGADLALGQVALRYLAAYGPASVADIAAFALVQRGRLRPALAALGDAVVACEGPGGQALLDVPGAALPAADTPAPPRLLGMWDNVLLAYLDRQRLIDDAHRPIVVRRNGDLLPTVLVDGRVAGVWRTVDDGQVEVGTFEPLPADALAGLDMEADALRSALADRDPHPFRRYDRWWAKLPSLHTTRLGV